MGQDSTHDTYQVGIKLGEAKRFAYDTKQIAKLNQNTCNSESSVSFNILSKYPEPHFHDSKNKPLICIYLSIL